MPSPRIYLLNLRNLLEKTVDMNIHESGCLHLKPHHSEGIRRVGCICMEGWGENAFGNADTLKNAEQGIEMKKGW